MLGQRKEKVPQKTSALFTQGCPPINMQHPSAVELMGVRRRSEVSHRAAANAVSQAEVLQTFASFWTAQPHYGAIIRRLPRTSAPLQPDQL